MTAIIKKEWKHYFTSLFGYFYYAMFFLLTGILFVLNCLTTYDTQFGYYVLSPAYMVVILILPFCTMRSFAQEKKDQTDQLIFTAPISMWSVLLGKYLAALGFVLVPVLLSGLYPVWIAAHGELNLPFLMAAYIAVFLVTLFALAVGMLISALTSNAILSAIGTYVVYGIILLGRLIESTVDSGGLYYFFHDTSIYNKYYDMVSGIVRRGDVIYCIVLTITVLLLTWLVLESKRHNSKHTALSVLCIAAVCAVLSGINLKWNKVYDFTPEHLLTLSEETKNTVSDVRKETDIYYMGLRSRANATYQELLNEYSDLNPNIKIHYVNYREDISFYNTYLSNISYVNEASILVVCDGQAIYLDSSDYVSTIQMSMYSKESILEIENQLTSAIYCVSTEGSEDIFVVTGHGEEKLGNKFQNLLLLNHYNLKEVSLTERLETLEVTFPENCKMVFLCAPQEDYSEEEIRALSEYMESGGKLLVILDPFNEELERLYAFLEKYGLEVVNGVVIEKEESQYVYDTEYYLVPKMQDTVFTETLSENHLQILTMTSKGIVRDGTAKNCTVTDVLTTSGKAFSKVADFENATTKGESDIGGPFSVASCAEHTEGGSLFLITSNLLLNEEVDTDSNGANRKFILNIADQLTGHENSIFIAGKAMNGQSALYPNTKFGLIRMIVIIVIPTAILLLGILAVVLRNKNVFYKNIEMENPDEEEGA